MKTYSLPEAARILGVDPDTLSAQARRGKLKARKVGRDWRVSEVEVSRYAAESLGRYRPGPGSVGRVAPPVELVTSARPPVAQAGSRFGAPSPAPKPGRKSERTG